MCYRKIGERIFIVISGFYVSVINQISFLIYDKIG